jgi:hypothetical protein
VSILKRLNNGKKKHGKNKVSNELLKIIPELIARISSPTT